MTESSDRPPRGTGEVFDPELVQDPYVYAREQHARYQKIRSLFSEPTPVTYVLIGVCLVVYLWTLAINHSLLGSWSVKPTAALYIGANWRPPIVQGGQWWRTISSMFLHAGVLHIGFNVWALYILGPPVERLSGRARFFSIIFIAGLGGALASLIWTGNPSVGISGAIFGLVGALFGIIWKFRREIPDRMTKAIRRAMIEIAVINLIIGFMIPMIDNSAHIGGCITGFVVSLLMGSRLRETRGQARRAAILACILAGLTLASLGKMVQQSKTCTSSEHAFMQCYQAYLPAPKPPEPPNNSTSVQRTPDVRVAAIDGAGREN